MQSEITQPGFGAGAGLCADLRVYRCRLIRFNAPFTPDRPCQLGSDVNHPIRPLHFLYTLKACNYSLGTGRLYLLAQRGMAVVTHRTSFL